MEGSLGGGLGQILVEVLAGADEGAATELCCLRVTRMGGWCRLLDGDGWWEGVVCCAVVMSCRFVGGGICLRLETALKISHCVFVYVAGYVRADPFRA